MMYRRRNPLSQIRHNVYPLTRPNRSRLAPPDRVMGNLRFMGIPNWLAFAVIGLVFILMMKNAYS